MSTLSARMKFARGDFELDVAMRLYDNRITALLGPSGSGKSTILRLIAGLERPHSGWIVNGGVPWFDAERRAHVPPQHRRVGLVFQDYALFDHLSVAANIGYGLPRRQRAQRVAEWLERLRLTPFADRYPAQLSGGQRQRVALGRALATDPALLLLDEPFSAIDATLRRQLRAELRQDIGRLNRPVLMVTHDLEEAYQIADEVCVMSGGRILRAGDTREVFDNPCSIAVARILGWRNFLPVTTTAGNVVQGAWGRLTVAASLPEGVHSVAIRPEHACFAQAGQGGIRATILSVMEQGAVREITCRCADGTLITLHRPWDEPIPIGDTHVTLSLAPQYLRPLLDMPGVIDAGDADRECAAFRSLCRTSTAPVAF